jgi:hypothetical protein
MAHQSAGVCCASPWSHTRTVDRNLERHILPSLGHLRLGDVRSVNIRAVLEEMPEAVSGVQQHALLGLDGAAVMARFTRVTAVCDLQPAGSHTSAAE